MQAFGVGEEQASVAAVRGGPLWLELQQQRILQGGVGECYYFNPDESYHYLMEAWTWARNGKAGLVCQYFPWIKLPEPLLATMGARTPSNALVRWTGDNAANALSKNYTAALYIAGIGRPEVLPTKFYDPNQILRRNAIFQAAQENAKMMSSVRGPRDPESDLKAYEAHCDAVHEIRLASLLRMQGVLVPSTHIYPSMNAILVFMAQEVVSVSSHLPFYTLDPDDPEPATLPLDGFANYMIRLAQQVKCYLFIADRIDRWILVHFGAQDCHSTVGVDMHISAIFHGLSQAGKSFLVKMALEAVLIKSTVTSILQSSEKAWNVHEDSIGLIIFKDEVENIWVDAKAAERDTSGASERLKVSASHRWFISHSCLVRTPPLRAQSMTSDQRTTYRLLVLVDRADGRAERKPETIESLFHATMWCCTNKKVGGGDEAIASRFFNFIMTRSETDLYEMLGVKDRLDDEDAMLKVSTAGFIMSPIVV